MATTRALELHRSGQLQRRVDLAMGHLASCELCPRNCAVDRLDGATGECDTGRRARVCSAGPHFGEESPLVGSSGSGTIFFGGCNLNCDFCQNCEISQSDEGREVSAGGLASQMLGIQRMGCHNLNLVTPTHVTPQIIEALALAIDGGLTIPIVYNCGGYESVETLELLSGIVDIYMPDLKFTDPGPAGRWASAPDYPQVAFAAIREMHRQVGDLVIDDDGLAVSGLLVRHLVLPEDQAGTQRAMEFLAGEISEQTYVNVMGQYRPCHRTHSDPIIGRRPTHVEIDEAREMARKAGLTRIDDPSGRARIFSR